MKQSSTCFITLAQITVKLCCFIDLLIIVENDPYAILHIILGTQINSKFLYFDMNKEKCPPCHNSLYSSATFFPTGGKLHDQT